MDRKALAVFSAFAFSSLIAFSGYVWLSSSMIRISEAPIPLSETTR
jgi:hypothetical protein